MQKQKKNFFRGSPEHFSDKNAIWDRHPHLHINCSLHVWGRAQGSQIFKRNSIISIRSKVMAFLVILLSPCGPRRPRVIPVVPMSSPCHPRHPYVVLTSFPCRPRHPQKVPMWSPWSVVSTCCPCRPHLVPVIPVSSLLSPRHLEGPHIMPNPPDTHSTHPPPPWGSGGFESVKMQ